MKKIFLALIVLIASSVNALATTVTVSAYQLQNLPFNPSNIGSDRSLTVSATNGSATVTSSAQFPSNIVGIGGFQVAIGGTQYVVSSVASTSTLILTTNYAGITGSATMTLYKYVLLRAYATAGFQDNVTGQNIQPGTPGSGQFYKQVAVSIINSGSGNVAYMPEFTIPSTTDALINNQARYVFGFYRPDGSLLSFYLCGSQSQLALQPNTPTTWTAICNYNAAGPPPPPPNTYYTAAQIDQQNPFCAINQLYYFAAAGNIKSCLTLGTNLSITSGVLNATGGGGGGNINPGSANQVGGYSSGGTTISPFTVGAQLTVNGSTLKGSGIRGAINAVVDYGAVADGATNTLTALQNAITAAAASGGKTVYLPAGTYRIIGTLSVPGGVVLEGDGKDKTIISSVSNAVIVDAVQGSGAYAFFGPKIRNLQILGSKTAGSSQVGLRVTDGTYVRDVEVSSVKIVNAGSHGLSLGNVFSSSFLNIFSDDNAGYPFYMLSPNMPSNYFQGLYAGTLNSGGNAGYRIRQGTFYCYSCNGINGSPAGSAWAIIGDKNGVDGAGSNVGAYAHFYDANFESWKLYGLRFYSNSYADIDGNYLFAADSSASGSAIALDYDLDTGAANPWTINKGHLSDSGTFANSPASFYANNLPIHANSTPPLRIDGDGPKIAGGSFQTTFYNSSTARAESLLRADAYQPTVTITTSTNYTKQGPRFIKASCASNCTVTLPSPDQYLLPEQVTVKNVSTTGIIVTVQANSGATVNGGAGSYTLSVQGAAATFYPDAVALDWSMVSNRLGAGAADNYALYDSSNTVTSTGSLLSNSSGALLFAGGLLFNSDNTLNIGASSSNRPAHIYSATDVFAPKFYNAGGGACFTSGSGTPEGSVTCEPGSIYLRTNGTWYQKTSGSGNTGWTLFTSAGSAIGGSGTTGAIAKFTAANTLGDSILAENTGVLTTTGTQVISGKTISTDATGTVASLTSAATFTKNDVNSRTFDVVRIKPTFNFGGANASTTVNLLSIDSTNTAVTGTIFNLINAQYGGATKWSVDSTGAITFATGVRQAFAPSASVASLNFGQIGSDPSAPVNGDCVYNTGSNKFRCYENGGWANMISGGTGTVNSGTQYQLGYYATTAAALSGNSGITTSATNTLTIAPTAASSGTAPVAFQVTGAAHTGLSASSEVVDINFALNRTVQRAAGGVTTDRSVRFQGRTVSFVSASTVTNEYNVEIESNTAGTNATLTASTALHTFPSVTTHHGIFADHQVGATGDSLRVGLSGSPIVRFNASGGTINSVFNANGALSTSATDGFQYISQIDSATNPTGVPTSYSGSSAIVLQNNTTNAQYVMKSYLNSGWRDLSQSLGHTTPAQITATQNNYNPGAVTRLQRWSSDTSRQVTGLTFTPTQMSGQEHIICNVGTNDIVLVHESASSTSTNRFATTGVANITIVGESCATVIYDGVTQRWRAWVNP